MINLHWKSITSAYQNKSWFLPLEGIFTTTKLFKSRQSINSMLSSMVRISMSWMTKLPVCWGKNMRHLTTLFRHFWYLSNTLGSVLKTLNKHTNHVWSEFSKTALGIYSSHLKAIHLQFKILEGLPYEKDLYS